MSETFRTEADVMVSTAGHVADTNNYVHSELNRLHGVVDGLKGSWRGSAQMSFDSLMQNWNTQATKLREALNSIAENIRSNAKSFEGMEAHNVSSFKTIGQGLAL